MGTYESKGGRPAKKGDKPFTEIFRQLIQGETQQTAADKIGVSRQNIGKWISGSTTPDIETLCKIANAYNVPADYLLGRTPNKTTNTELQAVCDYTGLSENAIETLHQIKIRSERDKTSKEQGSLIFEAISSLFSSEGSKAFIKNLTMYRNSAFINAKITIEQDSAVSGNNTINLNLSQESIEGITLLQIQDFIKNLKIERDGNGHYFYYYFYEDDEERR